MENKELYSIGKVSAISHIPVKTIRYYDSIGLLPACERNDQTGYRYYNKEKILQLFFINNLKNLGFSLSEIREIIEKQDNYQLLNIGRQKLEELQSKIKIMEAKYVFGTIFLERIQDGQKLIGQKPLNNQIIDDAGSECLRVEKIPAMNVIYLRQIRNNYISDEVNIDVWGELLKMAKEFNVISVGAITATYHNPPLEQFFADTCDYEISMPIMESIEGKCFKHIMGFTALTTIYVGRYKELINPYLKMMRWINRNQYKVSGNISETFLISPMDTGNDEDYITKIIIPIEKNN